MSKVVFFAVCGGIFGAALTGMALLMKDAARSYRLACWLPGGVQFYNGEAADVGVDGDGKFFFIPKEGPQTGHKIYTSAVCTWMELN